MIVRFSECERYDITKDCEVVLFMALTSRGTFHVELPRVSARVFRENRERFRERAITLIEAGKDPQEVTLELP